MTAPLLWSTIPHADYFINAVDVSSDGQTLVAGTFFHVYGTTAVDTDAALASQIVSAKSSATDDPSQYGTFGTYVYNAAGVLLQKFEFDGWQGVFSVAISAGGSTIASGGWASGGTTPVGLLSVHDVQTGTQLLSYGPPSRTNQVVLDAAGQTLLAASDQGYLSVRTPNGNFTTPLPIALSDPTDFASVCAISADGSTGAVLSYHGQLIVFKQAAGVISESSTLVLPMYSHTIAMSGDGAWVYCAGSTTAVYAINVANFLITPAIAWTANTPTGAKPIYALTTNACGSVICNGANGASGGVVMIWRNRNGQAEFDWEVLVPHPPNGVSMDADCDYVAIAEGYLTEGAYQLLSAAQNGVQDWAMSTSQMNWPIKISANGKAVVAGSDDGNVYYFKGPKA